MIKEDKALSETKQNRFNVGDKIFGETCQVYSSDSTLTIYKCLICGTEHKVSTKGVLSGSIEMCQTCKYDIKGTKKQAVEAIKAYRKVNKTSNKEPKETREQASKRKKQEAEAAEKAEYNRTHKGTLELIEGKQLIEELNKLGVTKLDDLDCLVKCNKCNQVYLYRRNKFETDNNPMCLKCGIRGNYINLEGKTFGSLKVTRELGGGDVICTCEMCGSTDQYLKQTVKNKTKCKVCGDEGAEVDRYLWSIVNDIYIIRTNYSELGAVGLCVMCGKMVTAPIGDVMSGKISCECKKEKHTTRCSYCGKNTLEVDLREGYPNSIRCSNELCSSHRLQMNKTNSEIISAIRAKGIFKTVMISQYELQVDNDDYQVLTDNTNTQCLVVKNRDTYVGRDRIKYKTCYCTKHRKHVLASAKELSEYQGGGVYDHSLCNTEFDIDVVELTKKND